jgi:hypothetical protein
MSYYRIDMLGDFLESVSEAERQAEHFVADVVSPKWLLISLHASAQGAMVLALHQGNGLAAMKDKDAQKWLEAHEKSSDDHRVQYPRTALDSFLSLYSKVKNPSFMSGVVGANPFSPVDHDRLMWQLNELRNQFIHFQVGSWAIEKALVAECAAGAVSLVNFLIDSPVFPWHRRIDAAERREVLKKSLQGILKNMVTL